MNPNLEKAVDAAVEIILSQNDGMNPDAAKALAISVMKSAGVAGFDTPAGPPPMPRHDPKTDVFAYGRELAKWNEEIQTSYLPPLNENVERARARLAELRVVSDNESAAIKVQRAREREELIKVIYGQNGGAL